MENVALEISGIDLGAVDKGLIGGYRECLVKATELAGYKNRLLHGTQELQLLEKTDEALCIQVLEDITERKCSNEAAAKNALLVAWALFYKDAGAMIEGEIRKRMEPFASVCKNCSMIKHSDDHYCYMYDSYVGDHTLKCEQFATKVKYPNLLKEQYETQNGSLK